MQTQKEQILQKIQEIKDSFKSFDELFTPAGMEHYEQFNELSKEYKKIVGREQDIRNSTISEVDKEELQNFIVPEYEKLVDEHYISEKINGEYVNRKPYRDTGNIKDKSTKLIHTALYNQFIDENNKKIDFLKSAIKELEDNNSIQKERIEFIQREEEWSHNKSEVLKNDPKLMEKVTKFDMNIHPSFHKAK
jgi:hypothetical protein